MAAKYLALFVVAAFVTQGFCVTEVRLSDESFTFTTNDLISNSIRIPYLYLDKLEACHVIMPNGMMYEAFPENNINEDPISVLQPVGFFAACGIAFRGAPVSYSGTYELVSLVRHIPGNSQSLTRRKFHVTFIESDPN